MAALVKSDGTAGHSSQPIKQFSRYERLDVVDRNSAEVLNVFCRVSTRQGETATRLANVAAWQSLVTSVPLVMADFFAFASCLILSSIAISAGLGLGFSEIDYRAILLISSVILPISHIAGLYPGLGLGSVVEFR